MSWWQVVILAIVQGAAELLPVSSSAHVIVAEKLMGLDPTAPHLTLLLVVLHTGTMFAVIVYFWSAWREAFFSSMATFRAQATRLVLATGATGVVGLALLWGLKHVVAGGAASFEVEQLFGNARLIAAALTAAGLLIVASGRLREGAQRTTTVPGALTIGAVQGLCLPFRGFSRSGATISTALMLGMARMSAEAFSFALAVILTPAVIVKEVVRLMHAQAATPIDQGGSLIALYALGLVASFGAGMLALRWLSRWLAVGRWHWFGLYCLVAALVVLWVG